MKSYSHKKSKPYLYVAPALLFVLLIVGYGLFMAGAESLSPSSPLANYNALFEDREFIDSLLISLQVAFISTALSIVVGVLLTRMMFKLFSKDFWKFMAWFPMLIPHFVAAYLVFVLFAPSGWFSSVLFEVGIISDMGGFPILVNDPYYIGVILTYMWKEIPFVILMLLPGYQELDFRYEDVVRTLGGSGWKVWRTVEFPWMWPVLLEIGLILFSFIMGAFEVPALLGVTYPKMLPILAFQWFYEGSWINRPIAQALMICLSIVTVAGSVLLLSLTHKWRKRWSREEARS
ncbi:ABC transporter permease [Bacillus marinisedimentorum]|uniref:ABC transporter permease n=1 Tax=Bacillus marinisedimentorum TaxID=1821260 RepID=UPI000872FCBF|nr:ABC transporter permease subunit [Bacillus marinisedimentorum]